MKELPASPAQASLLALTHAMGSPEERASQLSVSFGETIPTAKLRAAWTVVAARHGVLRSAFRDTKEGGLIRIERDAAEPNWRELDWADIPPVELGARWKALLSEEASRPLDLATAPVIRFVVIRLPNYSTHLLATHPRFFLDEESWFFLLCEWIEALESQLPVSEFQAGLATAKDAHWWNQYLLDAKPEPFHVHPLDKTPSEPCENAVLLDRETSRNITDLCQKTGIATKDLFLGLWGIILSRLSLTEETVVLATCESEFVPGAGLNVLPCRIRPESHASLEQWLREFSAAERARAMNSGVPLPQLPPPFSSGSPASASSLFAWLPPALHERIPEAFPRWINLDARILNSPLHPLEFEVRDGQRIHFRLRSTVLNSREASHMLARMEGLLHDFLNARDKTLGRLVLAESPAADPPLSEPPTAPAPLQDAIADVATARPEAMAVEDSSGAGLSYREVHDYSLLLAAHLRANNLGQGWTIAFCLTPSPWIPVALLGILHAGDTCLPLDGKAPPDWLLSHLEAGDAEMLICDSGTESLFADSGKKLLVIDKEWETIAATPLTPEPTTQPAVAVHCPGSPGRENQTRRKFPPTLLSLACNRTIKALELEAGERVSLIGDAGHPAYLETLAATLKAGATVLVGRDSSPAGRLLSNPTVLRITSQEFHRTMKALETGENPSLRMLAVDAAQGTLTFEELERWQKAASDTAKLIQFFSPWGFAGLGLSLTIDKKTPFLPGELGRSAYGPAEKFAGATFADLAGNPPPPGYHGLLRFQPSYALEASEEVRAWRDIHGVYYPADSPKNLPEAEPSEAAAPEVPRVVAPEPHPEEPTQEPPHPIEETEAVHPEEPHQEFRLPHLAGEITSPVLVLFHSIDGSTSAYAPVIQELANDWNVFGTVAPGRDSRQITQEAEVITNILASDWPDSPIHLLGIGYGGLVAFEVASKLRGMGLDVPFLVIAGTPSPEPEKSGWLGALKRGLAAVQTARDESGAPTLAALASTHKPSPLDGPCGIIITDDLPEESETRWAEIAPDASFEFAGCTMAELVSTRSHELLRHLRSLSGLG